LATAVTCVSLSASAQYPEIATLKAYAARALPRCAGSVITVEQLNNVGPANFVSYGATQTSTDPTCGKKQFFFYSPTTKQTLLGSKLPLPNDARPLEQKIAEVASQALNDPVSVTVAPFPLPDGIRAVSMTRSTKNGPFAYHGYVDASRQWLLVGTRGNLQTDPAQTLIDSLGLTAAMRRGNPKAKVKIIELSDFQCPTCAKSHKKVEPLIVKNLSKVDYFRLDLPLFEHHEWALQAALGARAIQHVAPKKYWEYTNFVFANQETITQPTFDKVLKDYCEDHDIDWAAVEKIYRSPADSAALLEQVSRAFDAGINSTPTYIVNGQVMGFGPEGTFTLEQIRKAIGKK
ncbi:MAG: thioredoxin domain-containing protein, partial [Thermoanaerobaculia bacterium]